MRDGRPRRTLVGRPLAIASFFAAALGSWAARAAPPAQPVEPLVLDYDAAGIVGCPSASELQAAVVAKSGFDPFAPPFAPPGDAAQRRLVVRFHRDERALHASLRVPLADRVEARTLTSNVGDCGELSESAALVVSLLLEPPPTPRSASPGVPSPPPVAPPPGPVALPPPRAPADHGPADGELAALAFGRVWAAAGLLPGLGIGPSLGGGVAIGPWEVRLELTWVPSETTGVVEATIDTQRWMVDAMPCHRFRPWELFSFTGCVSLHVGAIVYDVRNDDGSGFDGARAIAGIGLRPGAYLHLNEMFAVGFELEALAQLPALEVGATSRDAHLIGDTFAGRMLLGVDARFQ